MWITLTYVYEERGVFYYILAMQDLNTEMETPSIILQ